MTIWRIYYKVGLRTKEGYSSSKKLPSMAFPCLLLTIKTPKQRNKLVQSQQ